jgi:transcriptional regulator with XRE-family HTH domain
LQFNEYLKKCRSKYSLTQENLVQELYNFDDSFTGLDTRTLSRWEKGSTRPNAAKQVIIIQMFQKFSTHIFPCFYNQKNIEEDLCKVGIKNLIGISKKHIVNFPNNIFSVNDINISHIRSHDNINFILDMPQSIIKGLTSNYFKITIKHLKEWSLHPSNLFLMAQANGQFVGMFLILKLKPQIFKKLLTFEMQAKDLTDNDFANAQEETSIFLLSVFAYTNKIATLLYLRYYAHLIANQDTIVDVGSTPLLADGKKLAEKMHLRHIKDKKLEEETLSAYSAPIEDVLINEDILKMVFVRQDCPQDDS